VGPGASSAARRASSSRRSRPCGPFTGFGFIAPEGGGNDVFVHVSELERSRIYSLNDGDKVSFETKMDPEKGKPNAVNVKKA
jgi:CspA family cold shock protein